jgi:hypothetical protein
MIFIIPWQEPAAIYGSAYNCSPGYKSLLPGPEASHLTWDKIGISSFQDYANLGNMPT